MALYSGEIEVSKKTLLHISEGIYRTEGSSIKELISNAFDAKATKVIINTNYPTFDILTCQDNGLGMSEQEFLRIVKGGIGDSLKASKTSMEGDRPIIGKLGIGILAVAQICRSFTIISHHEESQTAFKGRMIFRTDVDKVAKEEIAVTSKKSKNYEIGTWELLEKLDYNPKKRGVLLFTKDLRQSYVKRFRENISIESAPENTAPLNYKFLLDHFYVKRAIKELGPYYELIWELSQLSPLPFYEGTPIRDEIIKQNSFAIDNEGRQAFSEAIEFFKRKNAEIAGYNFSVILDDIKLYRPTKLPSPVYKYGQLQECLLFYFKYDNVVRKRRLTFEGYFVAQENAILPRDLKGIQIRIKNVGIGLFDATFLKYDKIESPRDNWLNGEVYVEEGLESALNIDRDSFNENDEHYFILRQEIHSFLSTKVFPSISSNWRKKKKQRQLANQQAHLEVLKESLQDFFHDNIKFDFVLADDLEDGLYVDLNKRTIYASKQDITSGFNSRRQFFTNNIFSLIDLFRQSNKSQSEIAELLDRFSSIILY